MSAPPDVVAPAVRKTRNMSREVRRQQLIEATIDSLAKRSFAETTLADIAEHTGLSRGIVNFHFASKDALLAETLRFMADEYAAHWRAALAAAGPSAAERLWALVTADFDRAVCSRKKLAAWCAFWGQATARPTYRELCGARDEAYQAVLNDCCHELAGVDKAQADMLALGLDAMLEGLWLRMLIRAPEFGREQARAVAVGQIVALFPGHFTTAGPRQDTLAVSTEEMR